MEKERLFKMTETEQCVLVAALKSNGGTLASRAANAPKRRLGRHCTASTSCAQTTWRRATIATASMRSCSNS